MHAQHFLCCMLPFMIPHGNPISEHMDISPVAGSDGLSDSHNFMVYQVNVSSPLLYNPRIGPPCTNSLASHRPSTPPSRPVHAPLDTHLDSYLTSAAYSIVTPRPTLPHSFVHTLCSAGAEIRNICFCLRTMSFLAAANGHIFACHWSVAA